MSEPIDPRDHLQRLREAFYALHIGIRAREHLAAELFNVYLACRSNTPLIDPEEAEPKDPWPDLDLSDVVDKYVCQPLHDQINELGRAHRPNGARARGEGLPGE